MSVRDHGGLIDDQAVEGGSPHVERIPVGEAHLDEAAEIWHDSFLRYSDGFRSPFDLRFQFKLVDRHGAFFNVRLVRPYSRGPFDSEWSLAWTSRSFAHEMGHIMGLDDEYENNLHGGDASKCIQDSMMCRSSTGTPQDFHYYLILRRLACTSSKR